MNVRLFVSAGLLVASTALAANPPLYLLRRTNGLQQGIVRFDPVTREETPFADFIYSDVAIGAFGGLQIAAFDDLVVAQGAAYYEFDSTSGQLLRRYPALAPPYDTWAFQGAVVDVASAALLGVEPGVYGTPRCPPGTDTGEACSPPAVSFPGYTSRDNLSEQHVFLRRGLEPGDTSLHIVKLFSPSAAGGNPFGERFTTLDAGGHRFWFWLQGTGANSAYLQRLSSAPIKNGTVEDETIVRETATPATAPSADFRKTLTFAFDAARQSFFLSALFPLVKTGEHRLIRQSLDGTESVLRTAVAAEAGYDSIAAAPQVDHDIYTQLLPVIGETAGLNDTYWRSDAWFFNPSERSVDVEVQRVSGGAPERFTLAAGATRTMANIFRTLGGGVFGDGTSSDAAIVRSTYQPAAQLSVYSRTWTPAPGGGTFGQAVPAVPSLIGYSNHLAATTFAISMAETKSTFVLDKRDPAQFRHNIGFVNTAAEPLSIRLRYAWVSSNAVPDPEQEVTLTIPPHALRQFPVENLFSARIVSTMPPYITVTGTRPAALWLSMIDNKTGDASFIPFTTYGLETSPSGRLAFPAIIHAPGVNGTYWRTDAYGVISNGAAGGTAQVPEANFHGGCTDAAARKLIPVSSAPNMDNWPQFWRTTFPDLAQQFCGDADNASGALEVRTGSWMTMVSRTYTTRADGGTYGDILPLYPPRGWPSRHFAGIEVSAAFRANVGLYNGSDAPSTLALRLFRVDGTLQGETHVTLAARETRQRGLSQLFTAIPDGIYGLSVLPLGGSGCWPYVSLVDNVTGDPTNWW